jgi:hypothetical protein
MVGVVQPFEEREHCVGWLVAAGLDGGRRDQCECAFFDREVGVQVWLGGAHVAVPEPERDYGRVDARLQQ